MKMTYSGQSKTVTENRADTIKTSSLTKALEILKLPSPTSAYESLNYEWSWTQNISALHWETELEIGRSRVFLCLCSLNLREKMSKYLIFLNYIFLEMGSYSVSGWPWTPMLKLSSCLSFLSSWDKNTTMLSYLWTSNSILPPSFAPYPLILLLLTESNCVAQPRLRLLILGIHSPYC